MALLLLLAFLLATAATPAAAVAVDNGTHDGSKTATSPVLCNGEGCEPPAQALPIYGLRVPATATVAAIRTRRHHRPRAHRRRARR
jgi:hypothetical protein